MPAAFERCVKQGGRVRTVSGPNKRMGLGDNQYLHVCFKDGKSFRGHVKTNKKAKELGKS